MTRRVQILSASLVLLAGLSLGIHLHAQPPRSSYAALSALSGREDVVAEIERANAAPAFDMAARNRAWIAEAKGDGSGPMIRELLDTPLSRQLYLDRLASEGRIHQIMVMDRRGALVAADAATHDYDQSDEPKWQRTFAAGEGDPVFESSNLEGRAKVDQISQTVRDAEGHPIGAVTLRMCRSNCALN